MTPRLGLNSKCGLNSPKVVMRSVSYPEADRPDDDVAANDSAY